MTSPSSAIVEELRAALMAQRAAADNALAVLETCHVPVKQSSGDSILADASDARASSLEPV